MQHRYSRMNLNSLMPLEMQLIKLDFISGRSWKTRAVIIHKLINEFSILFIIFNKIISVLYFICFLGSLIRTQ